MGLRRAARPAGYRPATRLTATAKAMALAASHTARRKFLRRANPAGVDISWCPRLGLADQPA